MSKRGCLGALVLLFGCSDDGLPADTDAGQTTAGGSGAVSATNPSAGATGEDGPDTTDPTIGTTSSAPTTGNATEPADGSGGTDPSGGSTSGGVEAGEPVLYVSGGNAVGAWSIDEAGELISIGSLDQGTTIGPLAQFGSQFLYAARGEEQAVAALSIDPTTGALTELGVTGVAHRPVYLSVDPSGSWLLSADFGGDLVQVNPIEADGSVGETPSETRNVQSRPHSIVFNPGGPYVFVPHRDANLVEQYVFDDVTGTLTPNDPPSVALPEGAGARHLAFAPDASHAYVVNEFDSSVSAFIYDAAAGTLTLGQTVSALPPEFEGDNTGADVHVSADGAYVYASMRGLDAISIFATGDDGALTYQGSVETEPRPREFGLGPFGNNLYAAGQDSGMCASYRIEADGSLTAGPVYDVGENPLWVLGVELPTR